MPKNFRFVEKKRGGRRTGSTLAGRIGEAAFFAVLFLLGAASLGSLVSGELMAQEKPGLGFWLLVLVSVSFVLIGGGGVLWAVIHSSTSVERRSAIAGNAARIDLISQAVPMPLNYPSLPSEGNITNSPGTVLSYRLPTVESPVWGISAATLFCLAWNGTTAFLSVWAFRSWTAGRPEWFLTALMLPSFAVAAWSIRYLFRQLFVHTALGPTIMEVSNHPLYPGGRYEALLSQIGRLRMNSLEIHLTCEEEATFHQGTDIRHETRTVHKTLVCRKDDFRVEPGLAFEVNLEFKIPEEAMHSFQSPHNAVSWKLVAEGNAEGWPPFTRSFPILVYPLRSAVHRAGELRTSENRIGDRRLEAEGRIAGSSHGVGA